jgi:hypothetical protein
MRKTSVHRYFLAFHPFWEISVEVVGAVMILHENREPCMQENGGAETNISPTFQSNN